MLTQERLKELLSYDKETGLFTWLVGGGRNIKGAIAGNMNQCGYFKIGIDGETLLSHRLAFLYIEGKFPENQVDHINGKRDDNRFINIRKATPIENQRNQCIPKNNKSGRVGVCFESRINKWIAKITLSGKRKYLGRFDNIDDASKARDAAEKKYGFHTNHGKRAAI